MSRETHSTAGSPIFWTSAAALVATGVAPWLEASPGFATAFAWVAGVAGIGAALAPALDARAADRTHDSDGVAENLRDTYANGTLTAAAGAAAIMVAIAQATGSWRWPVWSAWSQALPPTASRERGAHNEPDREAAR